MHIPNRLQECRDPSALYMCAPICLYYFRCTYRTGCKNAETRAPCICVHLYVYRSIYFCYLGYYICLFFTFRNLQSFHQRIEMNFISRRWNVLMCQVCLWSNHQSCFEKNTWSDAFQVKLQLALCLQGPMRLLFVLENAMVLWWFIYFGFRCTDREVSEQDQQHPQPCFKIQDQDKVNFKLLSRSFNTSTFQITQHVFQHFEKCSWPAASQRFFQWSDFCRGQFVSFWLWFRFMIKLMSHVRQWEHRSGFIGDFYYYDVGLLFSSAYGFVFFSVCLHLHQKRH